MEELHLLSRKASELAENSQLLSQKIFELISKTQETAQSSDDFLNMLTIFILACFVGYYVVWKVTPALHTPLMSVTNAISGIIIVGALVITGFEDMGIATIFGVLAIFLASINIFGGFVVTRRMLKMFEKK